MSGTGTTCAVGRYGKRPIITGCELPGRVGLFPWVQIDRPPAQAPSVLICHDELRYADRINGCEYRKKERPVIPKGRAIGPKCDGEKKHRCEDGSE